jgi:hypothetical protein
VITALEDLRPSADVALATIKSPVIGDEWLFVTVTLGPGRYHGKY